MTIVTEAQVKQPAATIMIGDCRIESADNIWYGNFEIGYPNLWPDGKYPGGLMPRHNDGFNIGFVDGHAKWAKWSQIAPNTALPETDPNYSMFDLL